MPFRANERTVVTQWEPNCFCREALSAWLVAQLNVTESPMAGVVSSTVNESTVCCGGVTVTVVLAVASGLSASASLAVSV